MTRHAERGGQGGLGRCTTAVMSSRIEATPPAMNTKVIPMSPEGAKRAGKHRSTYSNAAALREPGNHADELGCGEHH